MAFAYISQYENMPVITGRAVAVGDEPALAEERVAIGGGSLQSTVFLARTRFVRLHTDAICAYKFGLNPTADVTKTRLAANSTEFFGTKEGQRVAIITST